MGDCNRCGKCCFVPTGDMYDDGSLILKACKYLIPISDGVYHCRIFKNRLGKHISTDKNGVKYYCNIYNSLKREINGCSINLGGKQLFNVEIITNKLALMKEVENEYIDECE